MRELETDPTTALWVFQSENKTHDVLRKMFWTAYQEEMAEQLRILDKLMQQLQEARDNILSRPDYDLPDSLEGVDEVEDGYSAAHIESHTENRPQFAIPGRIDDADVRYQTTGAIRLPARISTRATTKM